ncbi:MAG: hypothetical protein Q9209_006230 [Squamulea sp. 1 TL-2023]
MAIITERIGDIFESPPNSILIRTDSVPILLLHSLTPFADACNTKGSWGAGVAAAFKKYSPSAFHFQKHHCTTPPSPSTTTTLAAHQKSLVGTCLLIPPFPTIKTSTGKPSPALSKPTPQQEEKKFWIACLFTSCGYGKNVDSSNAILRATENAVRDLRRQIEGHGERRRLEIERRKGELGECGKEGENEVGWEMGACYSVRINSGLFGVPWEETKKVLDKGGVDMVVLRPPDSQEEDGKKTGRNTKAGRSADGVDSGSVKRGVKRKVNEEAEQQQGKGNVGRGKQTRLNFGKGK